MKRALWILLLLVFLPGSRAQAQGTPSCHFEPDGSITCTTGGGGGGGGGGEGGGGGNGSGECTPGDHLEYQALSYNSSFAMT